jgi:hypothetical protein
MKRSEMLPAPTVFVGETCLCYVPTPSSEKPKEVPKSRHFDCTPFYSVRSMTGPQSGGWPRGCARGCKLYRNLFTLYHDTFFGETDRSSKIPAFRLHSVLLRALNDRAAEIRADGFDRLNHPSLHPGLPITRIFDRCGFLCDHERMKWIDHDG